MKKVFLIGSAPYSPEWWSRHKHQVEVAHVLNNAKQITGDHEGVWYVATDYVIHSNYSFQPLQQANGNEWHRCRMVSDYLLRPKGYTCPHHGTMILNASYDILNRGMLADEHYELNLVGCDLDYSGATTHFYGKGTADPLRIPMDTLLKHLNKLKADFEGFHEIVTLGPPGILPFPQGDKELIWSQ